MNLIHLGNSHKCIPNLTLSLDVDHRISFESAWLMYDVMNNASSHNANFDQFHIMASYISDIAMFHIQNEIEEALSRWQRGGLA